MNKKGVSIIATVAVMLILSILGIAGVSLLGSSSSLALGYMQAQQAFYISEAGMEWYLEQLENDTDWSDNANESAKSFAGGSFTITVSNAQTDSITITSTATLTGYESQPAQRVLNTSVTRTGSDIDAFNYAIYVGGDIDTTGTENLSITGNQKTNAEDFPSVDYSYYEGIANNVVSGNKTFSAGTYSGIWYVDGNVTIDSNVTLNGSIITSGNINMNNNSNIVITATSPYPALVMEGNFLFQNTEDVNITGLIYVGANASGNLNSQKAENINFIGTILVKGNFNLQKAEDVTITYDSSITSNPPPGFSGTGSGSGAMTVSGWKEVL